MKKLSIAFVASLAALSAQAGDIYGGIGFPNYSLGYAQTMSDALGLRAEYSGGTNISKNGVRDGINFVGNFKSQMVGGFADWHPMDGGFRLTSGITFNDTKFTLQATGSTTSTINGKPVNLSGETFNVNVIYPSVTPYLGMGYGFKPNSGKGWGFYTDAGVTIGKFKADVSTSIVGKQGVTQADVDAQTATLRDGLNKLSVFPKFSVGASYSF
jgi:hypothetical protein